MSYRMKKATPVNECIEFKADALQSMTTTPVTDQANEILTKLKEMEERISARESALADQRHADTVRAVSDPWASTRGTSDPWASTGNNTYRHQGAWAEPMGKGRGSHHIKPHSWTSHEDNAVFAPRAGELPERGFVGSSMPQQVMDKITMLEKTLNARQTPPEERPPEEIPTPQEGRPARPLPVEPVKEHAPTHVGAPLSDQWLSERLRYESLSRMLKARS